MTRAYDKSYLPGAQKSLGRMLDFACQEFRFSATDFWRHFLQTGVAAAFGAGESRLLAGMSGIELAYEVMDRVGATYRRKTSVRCPDAKSPEYWSGWALAYYQWFRGLSFAEIDAAVPIDDVVGMYHPYHEMDLSHFVEEMDRLYRKVVPDGRLKTLRQMAGMSQGDLAATAGVSVRTIQEFEQGRKDINKAQVDTLLPLAKALNVRIESLVEFVPFNAM